MRSYWWLKITKDVEKYIDGYNLCQRIKNITEAPVRKLMANKISKKLYTYLTVEFITKLLLIIEKDVILVVCNRLSKIVYFVVATEGTIAEGLAMLRLKLKS